MDLPVWKNLTQHANGIMLKQKSKAIAFSDNNLCALKITILMWLCSLQAIVMITYTFIKGKKLILDFRILIDLALFGLLIKILDVYLTYSSALTTKNLSVFLDGRHVTIFSLNMA